MHTTTFCPQLSYSVIKDMPQRVEDGDPAFPDIPEARIRASEIWRVDHYRELTERGEFDRNEIEVWWSTHYHLSLSHGYRLRRRFRPDWTPAWLGKDVIPYFCDDHLDTRVRLSFVANESNLQNM